MLALIIIILILLLSNFILVNRSKRKRKFGIYPGRLTVAILSVVSLYCFFVIITSTNQAAPIFKKGKKESSLIVYQNELNNYMKSYNEKEKGLTKQLKNIRYLYLSLIVQLFIALILSVFGLITVPRRKRFYWITTISYVLGLSVILIGDWLFT